MPRGGKRPGAGAPRGNMNALKHGRRSRQFAELGAAVAQSPQIRKILLDIAARWDKDSAKADHVASRILFSMIARGLEKGPHGLTVRPPDADGRIIKRNLAREGLLEHKPPKHFSLSEPDNQTQTDAPPNNQTPDTKSH